MHKVLLQEEATRYPSDQESDRFNKLSPPQWVRLSRLAGVADQGCVALLACYLDDSYSTGQVVTLGGYIAPLEVWEEYELEAMKIYADFGITCLNAKNLRRNKGEFKNWKRSKKIELIEALFSTLPPQKCRGISVSVTSGLHKSFKKAHKNTAQYSPLGMAFGLLVSRICGDIIKIDTPKEVSASLFVEDGNKNNAGILREYQKMRAQQSLNSLTFLKKDFCKAIQLADFWALYSRRFAAELIRRPEFANMMDCIEPELEAAISYIPHGVDAQHGKAEPGPRGKGSFIIGRKRTHWFHPGSDNLVDRPVAIDC